MDMKPKLNEIAADFASALADMAVPQVADFDAERYKSVAEWTKITNLSYGATRRRLDSLVADGEWGKVKAHDVRKGNILLFYKLKG